MGFDFSWTTALVKGLRTAGIGAVTVAVASFFGAFDQLVEWQAFGAPEFIGLIAIIGVEAARNFVKQWLKSLEAE